MADPELLRAHLPIVGTVWRAWWHGHPARGRAPCHMGKIRSLPEASFFAKATEDETAGRLPMPLAPSSIGRCTRLLSAGLVLLGASEILAQTTTRPAVAASAVGLAAASAVSPGEPARGAAPAPLPAIHQSTMLGDALITSDMDSRSLIVVTDDQTFEVINRSSPAFNQPRPKC